MPTATAPPRRRTRELEPLAGLSAIDAITRLRALELRPAVEPCESSPEARGLVLAHEPVAGAEVGRGALVTLLVGEAQAEQGPENGRCDPPPPEPEPSATPPRPPGRLLALAPHAAALATPTEAEPPSPQRHPRSGLVAPVLDETLAAAPAPVRAAAPARAAATGAPAGAPAVRRSTGPASGAVLPTRKRCLPSELEAAAESDEPQTGARVGRGAWKLVAVAGASSALTVSLLAFALVRPARVGEDQVVSTPTGAVRNTTRREHAGPAVSPTSKAARRPAVATDSLRGPIALRSTAARVAPRPRAAAAAPGQARPSVATTADGAIDQAAAAPAPVSPVGPLPGPPPSP